MRGFELLLAAYQPNLEGTSGGLNSREISNKGKPSNTMFLHAFRFVPGLFDCQNTYKPLPSKVYSSFLRMLFIHNIDRF